MCLAVPVAVKLLHRGNMDLSRNLSSYLSLAALQNADLLAPYIQPIIDSIISGNYSLVRVLSKIYVISKEPIHDHIMALVCLLPQCDISEKSSLLNLFALISKQKPSILEDDLSQLSDCLQHPQTAYTTMQIFLDMAHHNNNQFVDYIPRVIAACEIHSGMVSIAAEFLGIVGTTITLLKQIKSLAEIFPSILPNFMSTIISQTENSTSSTVQSYLQQLNAINSTNNSSSKKVNSNSDSIASSHLMSNLVNSVKNSFLSSDISPSLLAQQPSNRMNGGFGFTPNVSNAFTTNSGHKLGNNTGFHIWNRSIPRLHVVSGAQSMSNPNATNVHRSLTALVASNSQATNRHYINGVSIESVNTNTTPSSSHKSASSSYLLALQEKELASKSSKNVTTSIDSQLQQTHQNTIYHHHHVSPSSQTYNLKNELLANNLVGLGNMIVRAGKEKNSVCISPSPGTIIETNSSTFNSYSLQNDLGSKCTETNRMITVLEQQYPIRDAVQHFCEKHIEKIKTYMQKVLVKIPLPIKYQEILIDELRSNRYFDVFKFNAILQLWGCFLCNHPDKATGFLKNSEPVIEGQLKEKKGRWKFFRRWRTRYFTLSGIHLYRDETGDKDGQSVEVGRVQSVRAVGNSRGRTIPKAFEIFTNDKAYVLKAKNSQNNQEWMQCLSIAMAHSQSKDR
ncbi:Protein melted [Sarcoptes scabiei]|uniref:Protein melted n=1 Tax=Sarcoptes scabiei TaxID=52283 RepID=A0A834RA81_SARSC|nr:Protein melted [Sarcoptes scabiei]